MNAKAPAQAGLAAFEDRDGIRRAPCRHDAGRPGRDARGAGLSVPRRADRRHRPRGDSRARAAAAAGARPRGGGACAPEGDRRGKSRAHVAHRAGLLRHAHAGRHPAQHPRESRVVHGVHAVPAGDLAGAPRGARQFPDDGLRPHGHGDHQCVDARRGDGGRRGDDACAARRQEREPALLRCGRRVSADARRGPHARRRRSGSPSSSGRRRTRRAPARSRSCCSIRAASATCATTARSRRRCMRKARSSSSPPTSSR